MAELTEHHRRHIQWLEWPLERWPEEALYDMDDPTLQAVYLDIEKRITQSVALQQEWGIPFARITPDMVELPETAHPIDRAWWKLHHLWMLTMQIMSFEQAHRLAAEHTTRRDELRSAILKQLHAADVAMAKLEQVKSAT